MKIYKTVILLVETACLFVDFTLHSPGIQGPASICVLKGQSVDLPCSPKYPTHNNMWYTVHLINSSYVLHDFAGDRNLSRYNVSEENNFTLTISDLSWSDENYYCCGSINVLPGRCWVNRMKLIVADLQVKVFPTTEGHTVTLMCSTSCALTEKPAAYIWYKNREFLYEDWSPWYHELVSSEEAVRYSCAIKGYEDLRAPEVSVHSVTETCFTVTYAEGRMCSYTQTSVDESCSITYPTDVHILKTPVTKDYVRLTCTPSCHLTDPQTAYRWYEDKLLYKYSEKKHLTVPAMMKGDYSCAVKGHEALRTAEVCATNETCFTVNYGSTRICAVESSSLNITAECFTNIWLDTFWYKKGENLTGHADRLEYHHIMNVTHILTIKKLTKNDSAEYKFEIQGRKPRERKTDVPGVILVVTDLKVKITPSAVVTEGQTVRLTCSTSCPLTDNTAYIWYFNSRLLNLLEDRDRNKHLVLDPVSRQHGGNYFCAVKSQKDITSPKKTLTVQGVSMAASNGIRLAVVLMIPISLLFFYCWRRRTYTMGRSHFGSMINASAQQNQQSNIIATADCCM